MVRCQISRYRAASSGRMSLATCAGVWKLSPAGRIASWASCAPLALAEYLRCFSDPAAIHASCEDYRAAASIDLEHDRADLDRKIQCPLLALWGRDGLMERAFDVLSVWRARAARVGGGALPCGHYLPEEAPQETASELIGFFTD